MSIIFINYTALKQGIKTLLFSFICLLLLPSFTSHDPINTISLAGIWRFEIDSLDKGINEKWCSRQLAETVKLPASMLENGKGNNVTLHTQWTGSLYDSSWYFNPRMEKYRQPNNLKFPFFLTPEKHYIGAAWYQKDVEIPQNWANQRVVLYLERPHYESRVWVNDREIPVVQNSLSAPHEFDLTPYLSVGKNTISIRIDNRTKAVNVGQDSHSISDQTQGNWNGIVGKIELRKTAKIWLDDVQIYPDLKNKKVVAKLVIKSNFNTPIVSIISYYGASFNGKKIHLIRPLSIPRVIKDEIDTFQLDIPMGNDFLTWDEFNPNLYRLTFEIKTEDALNSKPNKPIFSAINERTTTFGMREFKTNGRQFEINGRPIFLRGTVENCVFPLTGYAPMNVEAWTRVFKIAKNYGLNHFRFHSFCPPEAAFEAADLVGFYLQPEGPSWANHGSSLGDGLPIDQYIYEETDRIARYYGNYASFCMLAYGNEPRGGKQVAYQSAFVKYWHNKDNRHVYTGASVGGSWAIAPDNEYMVRAEARNLPWTKMPSSMDDYRQKIEKFTVPFVTHEMGQWCAFPNFKEIKKYTGLYKAKNFELFEEDLTERGMGDLANEFLINSGKLQVLSYKTELEMAFRTPTLGGFQLLSLNDYSGQGTALVGVLDAFWEEKGYVTAPEFRRFCNTTVPLIRVPKFVYTASDPLSISVEMAHFGKKLLENAVISWNLMDTKTKKVFAKGALNPQDIGFGCALKMGDINVSLSKIKIPTKLKLIISIDKTTITNDWDFWIYPDKLAELNTQLNGELKTNLNSELKDKLNLNSAIYFTDTLDAKTLSILEQGGKVFFEAAGKIVKGKEIVQYFQPVFWNTSWFKMRPPHTLGIVCKANHPVFADFLTDNYSDLQWWEILNRSQVMNLEDFPPQYRPLIQPIDTWFMNRKLGVLAEMKIKSGKLMICSADLQLNLDKRLVAKQLRYSVTKYMLSEKFNPTTEVGIEVVQNLLTQPSREQFNSYSKSTPDELRPKKN
jgi:hypothetical protein